MAQSFIPEGTMMVCTEMKSPMDNTIVRYRDTADVFLASKKVYLLTEKDLKLQLAFVCNINSKFWGGLKMLAAVVAIGALAIATVATGGLLLVAAGVAIAAVGVSSFASYREANHDCDFTTKSKWINVHDTVTLNGHKALIQNSKLICSKGGALSLVVDPVLARAAAQKIAANNTEEYNAHLNSQIIQGGLFVLSSGGDPRNLAFGFPLTVWNYTNGENGKQDKRKEEIEARINNDNYKTTRDSAGTSIYDGTIQAGRDAGIGTALELGYNPALMNSALNNVDIIKAYPGVVSASVRSAYPSAALRLNSSLYLAAARQTFNPELGKGLAKGFAWGVAGAVVDAGFDVYENSLYDDTIKFFRQLSDDNLKSKGVNIIAKNK
ncbi:DUF4280 domain-containing protein [Chryseobacterium sp. G0162]|uniref:PAAR-like protein n=1 Tax=unclassified Chryseobacterium TaxID=2593645 RepID=UPI000F4F023B|nr:MULTISPECIES: PAAR-like protein [unclassified Chryseobacterium]AZB08470.1 DUF4280 domain-containing protein [Chryseobacterium sp. G0162]